MIKILIIGIIGSIISAILIEYYRKNKDEIHGFFDSNSGSENDLRPK